MSAPRDQSFETASWLFIWAVIAVFGAYAIRARLQSERTRVRAALDQRVEKTMREGQNSVSLFEQDLKRKARDAEARRRAELEQAWGGRLAAALKNPEFSLRDALNEAAKACAPTNALAYVEVDRFTEFNVTVDSGETISTNDMVAFARRFLPVTKAYIDAVRFSHKGNLIAELDRQDIEFIDDWSRASEQRIAMLLPRESQSRIVQDPAAIERFKNEQRIAEAFAADPASREKAQRADHELRQAIQTAYDDLTKALEGARKGVVLGDVRSLRDLNRCDRSVTAAVDQLERARLFLKDPLAQWQKLLENEGISGDLREALVKGFPGMFRNNPAKTARVLEMVDAEIRSSRYELSLLTGESDKWKFANGRIHLVDEDFARRFDRAEKQVREDQLETEEALRAWREAVGP